MKFVPSIAKRIFFTSLLTVDFFVVDIFCIFIYKSHKENSNVQLYTLNLQLGKKNYNKVNSVVDAGSLLVLFFVRLSSCVAAKEN